MGRAGEHERDRPLHPAGKALLEPIARVAQEVRVTVLREPRAYAALAKNETGPAAGRPQYQCRQPPRCRPARCPEGSPMLDAVTLKGEQYLPNIAAFLTFRTAQGVLSAASTKAEADAIDRCSGRSR